MIVKSFPGSNVSDSLKYISPLTSMSKRCIFLCFPRIFPSLSKKTEVLYNDSPSSFISLSGMEPAKTWISNFLAVFDIAFNVSLFVKDSPYSINLSFSYGQLNISGKTAMSAPCFLAFSIISIAFWIFCDLLSTTFIWQRAILIAFMFQPLKLLD